MSAVGHAWWGELRHGGMLVAPQFLDELIPELPELDVYRYDRLRSAWLRLDAALYGGGTLDEARREFAGQLLEGFLGLSGWQKASSVAAEFKATSVTGEALRANWVLPDPDGDGALLAVWFDSNDTVGRGRGVRAQAKLVELLRATGIPLGLLTNGRQFRLVHAGPDYDAWAEWDAQTWFDESEGRDTLRGLAALLQAQSGGVPERLHALIRTIHESRNRQGDLAQVLGEQVRQGIELLVREVDHKLAADADLHAALWTDPGSGHRLSDEEALAAIYQGATRVVMRLVLVLYAEARDLLPANVEAYHDSYGVGSLYDTLARADREVRDALAEAGAAWPRILSLFRLVYFGSGHADLPVRAYGGQLFRPGDAEAPEPVLRALAALEAARPADAIVYRLLRLLKVGKVKVRADRGARWVAGAVDFSDLRTEYVGIVYEGLLDYELRRADADDPIVLLNVGRQPALPLSRLSELTATELKELLKAFKKDAASAAGSDEDGEDTEPDTAEAVDGREPDNADAEGEEESELVADDDIETEDDARARVFAWAREAVEAAGMVRRPRGADPDMAAYEQKLDAGADKLVAGLIPPGRLYLVASGGLRKGSGSFYTRPALSVPLAQRALEPLCYERDDERLVPRTPEEILDLKVCEPAMGSGSFLVAALRYLVEALHRSLEHHGRIQPKGDRETVITLPFGAPATGEEREEVLDLPPEDERFAERLRVQLARHVVERCLYGVDFNPMAVELARLALWIETLDRELPFEYLDHKLKVGNSLVGCWLHLVDDYPIRALAREGSDGVSGDETKWLKKAFSDAKTQMPAVIRSLRGHMRLFDEVAAPEDIVGAIRAKFQELHDLPRGERETSYRALVASSEFNAIKLRMDTWCALWFWQPGPVPVPLPANCEAPPDEANAEIAALASEHRFFHWEIEFPDVFRLERPGFDVVLGNPPWETIKADATETFSRVDPLFRGYSKTRALQVQGQLLDGSERLQSVWSARVGFVKALAGFVRNVAEPCDAPLGRGRGSQDLRDAWHAIRARRANLAHRDHPYRHQGVADLSTYKLFLDVSLHLLVDGGRLGMLVPSGLYTDKGATGLRKQFLEHCSWEWCYGFENRLGFFPIHRSYKFVPVVVERGGSTDTISAAFMRHDVAEWERPGNHVVQLAVDDIKRFSPSTWSFMEFKDDRDLELVERIYGDRSVLGEFVARNGGRYRLEFMMNTHDRLFTRRTTLEREGLIAPDDDARDPRVRARLRQAGFAPLYEGKSFYIHNPYFAGRASAASVSKFVALTTLERELDEDNWSRPRLVFRDIARSTDQRTLIVSMMPPAAHGNTAASLDGLPANVARFVAGLFGSLVLDYVVRMKVSAHVNWLYAETLPIATSGDPSAIVTLVDRLNGVGADFGSPLEPILESKDRLAGRLILDALVAELYGLHPDDYAHIASRFPNYDRGVPELFRYPALALAVFTTHHEYGPAAAEQRAHELAAARGASGAGFGFDELWEPDGGWQLANLEARKLLGRDGGPA